MQEYDPLRNTHEFRVVVPIGRANSPVKNSRHNQSETLFEENYESHYLIRDLKAMSAFCEGFS